MVHDDQNSKLIYGVIKVMSLRFETIALVGRPQTLGLENTLAAMAAWLEAKKHKVVIEESIADSQVLSAWKSLNFSEIAQQADLVISVGGDGTLLGAARQIGPQEVPLLGINYGRVGFVTDIPLSQWEVGLQTSTRRGVRDRKARADLCNRKPRRPSRVLNPGSEPCRG